MEFAESLKNIERFLVQKRASLKKEIKKILPEILQILCAKTKEWYDIDAPEYTKDVFAKFSQNTPKKRLKISLFQKKDIYDENDDNNQTVETIAINKSMEEYSKLMGEDAICD